MENREALQVARPRAAGSPPPRSRGDEFIPEPPPPRPGAAPQGEAMPLEALIELGFLRLELFELVFY